MMLSLDHATIMPPADREQVRRATIDFVRAPHPRNDDEDLHPVRLDETEAKLARALDQAKR